MKKKLFSLLLIAVLVLSSFATVFAEEADTVTMTFTGGKAGHTYTAYQVLAGDATAPTDTTDDSWTITEGSLENIQWGADAPATLKSQYATAAAAAKAIADQNDPRAFAQSLTFEEGKGKAVTLTEDGNVVFSGMDPGYYVIIDTNNNEDGTEGDYSSAIMVKVAGDVSGALKGDAPESDKKVADTNDTDNVQIDLSGLSNTDPAWKDSADYDIGDKVPFRLHATTANNVAAYKKYHITFQDTQDAGLVAPTAWTVTVLDEVFEISNEATSVEKTVAGAKVTVEKVTPDAGKTFAIKVTFEPTGTATTLPVALNSKDIYVKYESELGTGAVIGKDGNWNTSNIKYSNNPEDDDDSDEGSTPDDKVVVFTYKVDVDKVDETGAALNGANFTLYKEVPQATEGAKAGSVIKDEMTDAAAKAKATAEGSALEDDKYYVEVGQKTGDANGSTFDFKGIDDGTYVLVETTVPTGYNAYAPAKVVVTATHTDGDTPELTELKVDNTSFKASAKGAAEDKATKKNGTQKQLETGQIYTEVINNSGAELPETGGIGTTIIYILGAALVIGAGVMLVTRKKMND